MSDDPTIPPAPPAAPATPPATPDPALGPDGKPWDPARQQEALHKAREDARTAKAEATALKAKADELDALKAAQETESQRVQRERDEALANAQKANEQLRKGYLLAELAKPEHGLIDAEAAAALIVGVEYGDDGRPTNAVDRIGALLEAKGFLKAAGTPTITPAPNTNPGSGTTPTDGPKLAPEEVAMAQSLGMTPEKYAELKEVRSLADFNKLTPQT